MTLREPKSSSSSDKLAEVSSPATPQPFEVSEDARAHIAGVARQLRVIGDRDTPEGRGLQNLAGILTEALKGAASPATPQGPIPLNDKQEARVKEWSSLMPAGMWATRAAVEFNLRTFARVILGAASPATPAKEGDRCE